VKDEADRTLLSRVRDFQSTRWETTSIY